MTGLFGGGSSAPPSGPEVLLEESSPNGNVIAAVEADGQSCYFYLYPLEGTNFPVCSVWVRNLVAAPTTLDREAMRGGRAPLNPAQHCRHHDGMRVLRPADLEIIWLPEGNGAGLYEQGDLLAVIPPWSGHDGFHGFARDCIGTGPVAWQLDSDNAMIPRLREAREFWKLWERGDPWPDIQTRLLDTYESALGSHSNYYAIDNGHWPPKALLRIPAGDRVVLATIGVSIRPQPNIELYTDDCASLRRIESIRPQPNIELYTDDCASLRRIELGAALPASWPDSAIEKYGSYIAGQSNLPWSDFTWLGPGHTMPCDSWRNPSYVAALMSYDHPATPDISLGQLFGDVVRTLWFIPITAPQLQRAKAHGSKSILHEIEDNTWRDC